MLRRVSVTAAPLRKFAAAAPSTTTAAAAAATRRRWCSTTTPPRPDTLLGDTSRGVRMSLASECNVRDIVGLGNGGGNCVSSRLPAGELLSLIDICAARAASKHTFGKFTMGFDKRQGAAAAKEEAAAPRASVATVAMDGLVFKKPIMLGDLVDLTGRVVDVGSSSIAVHVVIQRQQFGSKQLQRVADALVFMVAVGEDLSVAKIVPALDASDLDRPYFDLLQTEVKKARHHLRRGIELGKALDTIETADALAAQHPTLFAPDPTKTHLATIESTRHHVNRLFFPSHLNLNNTVFGGELLRWMEQHAVHCGRMHSGNRGGVFTIGMHAIQFRQPVYKTDWMTLEAHVVYVKRTTMEIDVRVVADRDGKRVVTNKANFVLASLDEAGQPLEIPAGLKLTPADDMFWLRRHVKAGERIQWLKNKPLGVA